MSIAAIDIPKILELFVATRSLRSSAATWPVSGCDRLAPIGYLNRDGAALAGSLLGCLQGWHRAAPLC
jgi:hypothetical protein